MALTFASDVFTLYGTNVSNDANYQAPGNFGLATTLTGASGVDHATITAPGTYTTVPAATAPGGATFTTRMKILAGSTIAAAGTVYAPGDVLSLVGGTKSSTATLTVATAKLVSATIAAGGTGYGNAQTVTVTVAGGTQTSTAQISVTSSAGGVITTINSVSQAGSYTVLPSLAANVVTGGAGTGLTLNLVFGVNTFTVSAGGVYTALPANPIAVTGGGGTGFTLTGSWGVDSLVVTAPGAYQVAPVITFGSGTATATAVLAGGAQNTDEQKLLLMVEVFRSLLAELNNPSQAKDLHEVIRKMLAQMRFGGAATFSASAMATAAQAAAMHYIANNPKHAGANI